VRILRSRQPVADGVVTVLKQLLSFPLRCSFWLLSLLRLLFPCQAFLLFLGIVYERGNFLFTGASGYIFSVVLATAYPCARILRALYLATRSVQALPLLHRLVGAKRYWSYIVVLPYSLGVAHTMPFSIASFCRLDYRHRRVDMLGIASLS
jgi:hypothetical protein